MRTTNVRIEDRIRSIVRADYDDIAHPSLPELQLPPQITFFQITVLARFWDAPETGGESLAERMQRLITGLRSPWTYVVLGEGSVASVFIGLPCRDGESRSWEQRLTAQLPGSSWRMGRLSQQILATLAGFPMVAVMSGNPSISGSGDRQSDLARQSPGLESLFETMAGVRWAYMVLAQPLSDQEVADDLRRIEDDLRETNSAFRRRGGAEENNNPLVARYVELLESAHRKLLQGQRQGAWDVQSYLMADTAADCERGVQALHAAFGGPGSEPQPLRIKAGGRNGIRGIGTRMTTRLNTSEVAVLASLPRREVAGLVVTDYVAFGMAGGTSSEDGIALGTIMSGGTGTPLWFDIPLKNLCNHLFVAGVTGSGKTRTCQYILSQLWREHQIPWLVLEPSMKSEYRALLRSAIGPDLAVFTAGDETVSPLRMNPLEVPDGVQVQTHIGELASLFKAAFAMEAPIPYVLDEAIHRVYEEHGWDTVNGDHHTRGDNCQPTLTDLLQTCERVVDELGHEERVKANIRGALRTRLTSLMRGAKGRMFNVRRSIPMADLLSKPTVIEFSAIGDDEEKSFLLGCLLLKLVQHRRTQGRSQEGQLRHVTLVEEAHRLLRNVPETVGTSVANPRRQAIETFCHMLAEIRADGEGIVVVEQMPSKLVPDAIRNSGAKVIHRLTAEEERKLVGGAMSLNEAQVRFLAVLRPGEAVVYADGSVNACRIFVPDHAGREGYLRNHPSQAEIKAHMQGRIQPFEAAGGFAISAKHTVGGDVPCRQMHSCPDCTCARNNTVAEYARLHERDVSDSFQRATGEGFDAMWQLGRGIARAIWQDKATEWNDPFCAIMAVAGRMGMKDRDLLVLRRNMVRLRELQKQGGAL